MALKWGIVTAGKISHDFVNALETLSPGEHQVVAVAARDLDRAKEFAARFDIPNAYGSYLKLAKDPNIDVAYIGVKIEHHLEITKLMLEHGKHVLCEKPLCINEKQVRELISFAKEKNLFLMEAIWSRCFPSYHYIRQRVKSGALGEVQSVEVEFGLEDLGPHGSEKKKMELRGGSTIHFGVYPIQFCQFVFQLEPKSIKATGVINEEGVDLEMSAELNYGDNKVAKIRSSVINTLRNEAKIVGTKGQMTIPSFWNAPSLIDVDGTEKSWPFPKAKCDFNYINSCGLRYEADEVRKCIRAGKKESELISHDESLIIVRIEDEIRKQVGVKYPEDV